MKPSNIQIPTPPPDVFAHSFSKESNTVMKDDVLYQTRQGRELMAEIDHYEFPESGGQYVYHKGAPYPLKGFPFPHAVQACEIPKRILINGLKSLVNKDLSLAYLGFLVLPKRLKARIVERFMTQYLEIADMYLMRYYLIDNRYTDICRELLPFITRFCIELGISQATSVRFATTFTTLIEYDSAYRLLLEDILTETTQERLLAQPVKEARRLLKILAERDHRTHLVPKFEKFVSILRFVREPFRNALRDINFEKMQFDIIDRFLVRNWNTYDFGGKSVEERMKEFPDIKLNYAYLK